MRRSRTLWSAVCALVMVGTLGACSSSSKSTSGSSSPTNLSAGGGGATGAPIKIGLICTCSGSPLAGPLVPGEDEYKAWANTVNASGGIDGHPVQLIVKDDTANPGTSLSEAQSLISDHVVAIADNSNFDQTWAKVVQAAKIPVVGILTDEATFGSNPDFYPEAQTNDSAIYAVVSTAKAAGANNLANVYCSESPICAESVPAFTKTGQTLGVPVVYNAEISATAPNYTAQCLAAKQKGVKSVFIGDAPAVIVRVAGDCAKQGYNPVYVQEGGAFGMNEAPAPGLKNSLWLEFPAYPFFGNSPAVQASNKAMDKYFPGIRENSSLFLQDAFMAWTSGKLLEDAVNAGGLAAGATPTAAEIVKGLDSLKADTVGGLTPPLTFTPGQPHNVNCWFTVRLRNGVPSLTNSGKVTCENGSSS